MNIGSSKSIWVHGGRFHGGVSSPFSWGEGVWGSSIPDLQILDLQRLASLHLVCIRIHKEQEREMIFDLHQRLPSNQANKNSHLV